MTISERLFSILDERDISIPELGRMTGISRFTINDWHKKKTNPGSDKIMIICEALEITPEELLMGGREERATVSYSLTDKAFEAHLINECRDFSDAEKRRIMAYINMLKNTKKK